VRCSQDMQIVIDLGLAPDVYYKCDASLPSPATHMLDSVTARDLIRETGNVPYVAGGKYGNAVRLTYPPDFYTTYTGDDPWWVLGSAVGFSVCLWVRTKAGSVSLKIQGTTFTAFDINWTIQVNNNGAAFDIITGYGPTTSRTLGQNIGGSAIGDGNWHMVICTYNAVTGCMAVRIDYLPADEEIPAQSPLVWNSHNGLYVYSAALNTQNLQIDEFSIYKEKVLTNAEMDYLWNSGAGRTWP